MLTDYEKKLFANLETLPVGVVYKINPDRPDREQFISGIKKAIEAFRNFEFNSDMTRFRRIETIQEMEDNPQWKR